ncbi:Uncharacterised protein [uncultured archaeon]|nr:Uncharacterised protein [uncultured archaeon]
MSKQLLCTIAITGNCMWYNESKLPKMNAVDYSLIEVDDKKRYSCKTLREDQEFGCSEIEKLNLLSKLANK